jgi:hypothetical protein
VLLANLGDAQRNAFDKQVGNNRQHGDGAEGHGEAASDA